MRVLLNLLTTLNWLLIYFTWKKLDKKGIFMSKYFMKNNEKSARSQPRIPDYEKMQADSSHQQQQQ